MKSPVVSKQDKHKLIDRIFPESMKNFLKVVCDYGEADLLEEIFATYDVVAAEKYPTISVGGILHSIGGNIRVGGPELFVTEACEYTNSFLSFFPTMEIILNIEADHLDFFKDLDDIRHSFRLFAEKLDEKGLLIINRDIKNYEEISGGLPCRVVTFGHSKESDYSAADITYDAFARPTFTLVEQGKAAGTITLGVPGEHNVYNALAFTPHFTAWA